MAINVTPANILVGSGHLEAFYSLDGGTAAAAFHSMGGFRDGLTINFSEDRVNIESQDSLGFVKSARSRAECTITTSLLESTFDNLSVAMIGEGEDGTPLTLSAKPAGDSTNALAARFTASSGDGDLKTWTFSSCVPVMDIELTYTKDAELLIPITFMCLAVYDATNGWGFGQVA